MLKKKGYTILLKDYLSCIFYLSQAGKNLWINIADKFVETVCQGQCSRSGEKNHRDPKQIPSWLTCLGMSQSCVSLVSAEPWLGLRFNQWWFTATVRLHLVTASGFWPPEIYRRGCSFFSCVVLNIEIKVVLCYFPGMVRLYD